MKFRNPIHWTTKVILTVLAGMVVLFLTLVFIRVEKLSPDWSSFKGLLQPESTREIEKTPLVELDGEIEATPLASLTAPYLTAYELTEVRLGPGLNYERIAFLDGGQSAVVVGKSQDDSWWAIDIPYLESGSGWVLADQVIPNNVESIQVISIENLFIPGVVDGEVITTVTAIANINVRSGPSMGYERIGLIANGQVAEVLGASPDGYWMAIRISGSNYDLGWISIDYVVPNKVEGLPIIQPRGADMIPFPQPEEPALTATAAVNVRSGPGTNYDIVVKLERGQQARVIGVSANGLWWIIQVKIDKYDKGWVSARFVIAENTTNIPIIK